ncbi:molybdenum cofactor guanylyltransferase [Chloroflexota bacterium]
MKVTTIILAGGKNLRLGRNKALEIFNGHSLIEHIIERLSPLSSQTLVVTSQEQTDFPAASKAEVLVDLYPGKGPLGGIYTGLQASLTSHSLVVACDMPFLNTDLLKYMIGLSGGFDAVVPKLEEGMVEPLHAIYSHSCIEEMKKRLESNHLGVHTFLNTVRVRYIEREEIQRLDPEFRSFFNINYQKDLERAIDMAGEIVSDSRWLSI